MISKEAKMLVFVCLSLLLSVSSSLPNIEIKSAKTTSDFIINESGIDEPNRNVEEGRNAMAHNSFNSSVNDKHHASKGITITSHETFIHNFSLENHWSKWMERIVNSDYNTRDSSEIVFHDSEEEEEEERVISIPESSERDPLKPKSVDRSCQCGSYNPSRIVHGSETAVNAFPWMVSLQLRRQNKHFCGASIISDYYVLTAAHCTYGHVPNELQVRVGDHDLTTNDVSRERTVLIRTIIQHEGYDDITTNNDISLLRLEEKLQFTWRVNPICLPPSDLTFYKEEVTVMGWGAQRYGDKDNSPTLRYVNLKIINMATCRYRFKFTPDEITSKMLCASGDKADSCQGDSGGPLAWLDTETNRYFMIGITSWGVGCGFPNYPGVYTKVAKFLPWLYQNTKDSVFCKSFDLQPKKTKNKEK